MWTFVIIFILCIPSSVWFVCLNSQIHWPIRVHISFQSEWHMCKCALSNGWFLLIVLSKGAFKTYVNIQIDFYFNFPVIWLSHYRLLHFILFHSNALQRLSFALYTFYQINGLKIQYHLYAWWKGAHKTNTPWGFRLLSFYCFVCFFSVSIFFPILHIVSVLLLISASQFFRLFYQVLGALTSEHTQKSFDRLASIHSVKFNDSSLGVFFSLWSHLSFLHPIRIIDIIKFEMIVRLHKRIFGAAKKAAQTPTNEWTMKPWQLKWALHAESPEKSAHNRQRDLLIGSCSHLSRQ